MRKTSARGEEALARACMVIKIDAGTRSSWDDWGSPEFERFPFLPSLILNLHLRYFNMSGANFFAGAHHFVLRDNIFIEAQTVSGMFNTKAIRQAS